MTTPPRCALALTSLLSLAGAQSPPAPNLVRIERQWPAAHAGLVDRDLACGRYVPNHPARCVAAVRDDKLFLWFQLALFDACADAQFTGVQQIATIEGVGGGADVLAVITEEGLRCLRYEGGFVAAQPPQGELANWAGAHGLDTASAVTPGGPMRYALGWGPGWIRVARFETNGLATQQTFIPVPPGNDVRDAKLVQWQTSTPELEFVVLTATGLWAFDLSGDVIDTQLAPVAAGKLGVLRSATAPSVTLVAANAATPGTWQIATWAAIDAAGTGQLWSGGALTLPLTATPTGIASLDVNGDPFDDVALSTTEPVRYLLLGTSNGPQVGAQSPIQVWDVRPNQLPQPPLVAEPNLAPAVVDDIDRDGTHDLVIGNQHLDRMIAICRVRPQVQQQVFLVQDDGDAVPTLTVDKPIGFSGGNHATYFSGLPLGPHGFGLRLRLPQHWTPADSVRAVLYEIQDGSIAPADDPVSLDATAHYLFPLTALVPGGTAGAVADVMFPIPNNVTQPHVGPFWGGGQRYALELSLLNGSSDLDTAPVIVEFANLTYDGQGFDELLASLSTTSAMHWWFDIFVLISIDAWLQGLAQPTGVFGVPGAAGPRFIGGTVLVESEPAVDLPDVPSSTTVHNNGVAHVPPP